MLAAILNLFAKQLKNFTDRRLLASVYAQANDMASARSFLSESSRS